MLLLPFTVVIETRALIYAGKPSVKLLTKNCHYEYFLVEVMGPLAASTFDATVALVPPLNRCIVLRLMRLDKYYMIHYSRKS